MTDSASKLNADTSPFMMMHFHCVVEDNGQSVKHFTHEINTSLYDKLENLYIVLLAETKNGKKKIVAGFAVKTNLSHHSAKDFAEAMREAIAIVPRLEQLFNKNSSVIPFRVGVPGGEMLTEEAFLQYFAEQGGKIGF